MIRRMGGEWSCRGGFRNSPLFCLIHLPASTIFVGLAARLGRRLRFRESRQQAKTLRETH